MTNTESILNAGEVVSFPVSLDRAGARLDKANAAINAAGPVTAAHETSYGLLEREKDHADIAYRALLERVTGQAWTDIARRLSL